MSHVVNMRGFTTCSKDGAMEVTDRSLRRYDSYSSRMALLSCVGPRPAHLSTSVASREISGACNSSTSDSAAEHSQEPMLAYVDAGDFRKVYSISSGPSSTGGQGRLGGWLGWETRCRPLVHYAAAVALPLRITRFRLSRSAVAFHNFSLFLLRGGFDILLDTEFSPDRFIHCTLSCVPRRYIKFFTYNDHLYLSN